MSGLTLFNITLLTVLIAALFVLMRYQKNKRVFKQALVGILIFSITGFAAVNVFGDDKKGDWFAYTELYAGLDTTLYDSPQCFDDGPSNRITSNGGITQNIFRSFDKKYHLNFKYTHHSCAFNEDSNVYDGFGFELRWRWDHK